MVCFDTTIHRIRLGAADIIDLQKKSVAAACRIVDIILLAMQNRITTLEGSGMLKNALVDHLECHKAAYNEENIKPTFHYMFDVACQWGNQQDVIDAFIIERLHLRVETVAEPVRNNATF